MSRWDTSVAVIVIGLVASSGASALEGYGLYTTSSSGNVVKCPIGGSPVTIRTGGWHHACWSADGKYVYCISSSGTLGRMYHDGSGFVNLGDIGTGDPKCPIATYRPDPNYVFYVDGSKFYKVSGTTGNKTLLQSADRTFQGEFAIDDSGTRIAGRADNNNLYKLSVGSSTTTYIGNGCSASITPDGNRMTENLSGHTTMKIWNWNLTSKTISAPSRGWDNQRFAANSNVYIVYNYDNLSGIGVTHVDTGVDYNLRYLSGWEEMHPDLWIGSLPPIGGGNSSPSVNLTRTPTSGTVPLTVNFDANSSDADGDTLDHRWDWSYSGSFNNEQDSNTDDTVSHTFDSAGTYTVAVWVSDGVNSAVIDTVTVTATDPVDPTVITSPSAGADLTEGTTIQLTGTGAGTLTWSYDANADGLGAVTIGTGSPRSFTIPTGVNDPKTIDITLSASGGSDTVSCNIVAGAPTEYTLSVNSGTGDGSYTAGTVVDIAADSPPSGQEFDAWTGNVANVADVNDPTTTITMPASNATVTATYKDIPVNDPPTVSFSQPTDGASFVEGSDVDVTVAASDDSAVDNVKLYLDGTLVRQENGAPYEWSAGVGDTVLGSMAAGTYELEAVATDDQSATASASITITVTPSAPTEYTLSVSNGTGDGSYEAGTVVDIAADSPPAGQEFDAWTGNVANVADVNDPTTTITMPASNVAVTATYKDLPVDPTVITSPSAGASLTEGTTIQLTGTGEGTLTWSYDANSDGLGAVTIGTGSPRSFTVPSGVGDPKTIDITLTASGGSDTVSCTITAAAPTEYTLSVNAGTGDGSYTAGTVVDIAADAPPSGQEFDAWTGDVANVADVSDATTTITMPASDVTVGATYKDLPANPPPTVSFSQPTDGASFVEGADVDVTVAAGDDGAVDNVKLYLDGALVRQENGAPYEWSAGVGDSALGSMAAGTYELEAVATDDEGATASATITITVNPGTPGDPVVSGELKKWHKITITFEGPATSESATPNPFTDYRLDVTFTNGPTTYVVPGYYCADGDAAETSATSGNTWRVHFAPDATGTWNWSASFRTGADVATSDVANPGSSAGYFDGETGSFVVTATDKTGRDHRGKGRLQYVNKHHLRFAETGEYFMKCGADAPENFLAYADFDGDFKSDGISDSRIKTWSPHVGDWNTGDPTWQGTKGKGIIGAINYLASEGLNVFSFLPMNINGDDKNVFPYTTYSERYRMDCSKLDQWEILFEHADSIGMYMHFKTQETENETLLDGGDVGPQRKLYYRELIARFAHHLALNWNLGEENSDQTDQQRKDMAQYFHDNDPYNHNIVIHTYPGAKSAIYTPLLGSASELTGTSLQTSRQDFANVHGDVLTWVTNSAAAGKPWVVACDEPGDAQYALVPDSYATAATVHENARKNALWGDMMAGGAGVEWYFGYAPAESDLTCQDFRSRDQFWDVCRHALHFFDNYVPFQDMTPADDLVSNTSAWCLAQAGQTYVVFLKNGGTTDLDLGSVAAAYDVQWYNPRSGGALQDGSVTTIVGPGSASIGNPPSDPTLDWAALVTLSGSVTTYQLTVNGGAGDGAYPEGANVTITADAPAAGKMFDAWTGDVTNVANVNAESTTITMPAADATVTATYQDIPAGMVVIECEDMTLNGYAVETFFDGELVATMSSGTATTAFPGATDSYEVQMVIVKEDDGQPTLDVSIDGTLIQSITYPLGSSSRDPETVNLGVVSITAGDEVLLTGTLESGAAARADKIIFIPASAPTTYALTVTSGSGDGDYTAGTVVDIAADAPAAGKVFDAWTGDVANVANVNAPSTTITMPAADATVAATYVDAPPTEYALTVTSGSGDGDYAAGTVVDIAADAPPAGKVFDAWTGDVANVADVNAPSTTITMPAADATVVATYVDAPVDPTVITFPADGADLTEGTSIGLTGTGTGTLSWSYDANSDGLGSVDIGTGSPCSFTVPTGVTGARTIAITLTADGGTDTVTCNIVASAPTQYALTVNAGSGDGSYAAGAVVDVTADAAPSGQQFDAWTGDVATVADVNAASTTITMPSADATITATYADIPVAQGPYGGTAWAIPGSIEAEDYDQGGEGVAYSDTTSGNQGGVYRDDDVDIQDCTDSGGGYNVGWTVDGEWLEYSVTVGATDAYDIGVRVATPQDGKVIHIEIDGVDVSGAVELPNTGGWQTWQTATVADVALAAGAHVLHLSVDAGGFNLNRIDVIPGGGGVVDTDGDGLSDADETGVYGTDPSNPDSDGDGVSDGDEVNVHGTDPNDADSDADGISDGEEINTTGTDPNDADTDADGMTDGDETDAGFDPLVDDQDGNGVVDGQDDWDGDGTTNADELLAGSDPGAAPAADDNSQFACAGGSGGSASAAAALALVLLGMLAAARRIAVAPARR